MQWCQAAWVALAILNAYGFLVAAVDKWRAWRRWGRVPEAVLLGVALMGGWSGVALALLLVRHKTRKRSFLARFVIAAVASTVAWAWVATTCLQAGWTSL